jgi:hypothetical protein
MPGRHPVGGSKWKSGRAGGRVKIRDRRVSRIQSSDLFSHLKKIEMNYGGIHDRRLNENGQRPWARREGFDPAVSELQAEGTGNGGTTKYKLKSQALPCQPLVLQDTGPVDIFQQQSRWRTEILRGK